MSLLVSQVFARVSLSEESIWGGKFKLTTPRGLMFQVARERSSLPGDPNSPNAMSSVSFM